jgi:hypothetical protein
MKMKKNIQDENSCNKLCSTEVKTSSSNGLKKGIVVALVPHVGCIAFIILTLLGISAGAVFLKNFLTQVWAFPALIIFSFGLAGISSYFYLKRNCCVNKTKYVSILFGSVFVINALLFFVIFPWAANVGGQSTSDVVGLSELKISVAIPCPGHASLIISELKTGGASEVTFNLPNVFDVKYDSSKISKQQLLSLPIFESYKANEIQ